MVSSITFDFGNDSNVHKQLVHDLKIIIIIPVCVKLKLGTN